jgi:hypothetical protein
MNHFQKYAKAYTGGISAGGVGPAAATIVVWLLGLTGLDIPENVRQAIEYLTTAAVTTGMVALVGNMGINPAGGDGEQTTRLLRQPIDWTKRLKFK